MDSITMLYEYQDRIKLGISFDYGSNHNAREIPFAQLHCERLGIRHITINLGFMQQYFKSSLLEGAEAVPEGNYDEENMKSTVVPFRNGIMLSIAIGIAETHHLKYVMMANHGATTPSIPTAGRNSCTRCRMQPRPAPMRASGFGHPTPTSPRLILPGKVSKWALTMLKHGAAIRAASTIAASAEPVVSAGRLSRKPASKIKPSMKINVSRG